MPRPRFRLPLWSAVVIAVAAYAARSVMRGLDFRLDLPTDVVVLGLFAVVVGIVGYLRSQETDADHRDGPEDG